MAQTVKLKRSNTAGTIPTTSNLALGEVAINTKDGKFFLRKHVDGSTGDAIHAYAPQGLNAFGTQELVVKVVTKTTAHPNHGSGSSSGYTVQGLEGPFLALIPGNTYKFDVSDSTNSGHPFRFYLDAAKATAYTTGVTTSGSAGNSGAYVQIAVTTSTPQVLYYQCSAHSLMGSAAYVASDAIAANAVGTSQIAQNSITSSEIPDNSIGATQISAAVLAAKQDNLGNNSITAAMISQNTVGISELNVTDGSANQVLTTNGSGTLSFANPSSGTVTETFKTISVSGQDDVVADGATDTLTLAGSGGMTITTTAGSDTVTFSSSTTPADDSVVTAKIADLNVTAGKIAANAVTAAKIATDAVGASEIAANSVGISELNVSDGSNGQVLTTNGSGTLSFATASGSVSEAFKTISVSGQDNVVADSATDTLTFAAGSNITLTTNASSDTVTIAATGIGGSSTSFAKNTYTGDGSTTAFTLSTSMSSEDGLIVFIDGVYQADNVYSVSGTTLTFATAPVNGRVIEVFQVEGGIIGTAPVVNTMTGDGSDTTLTLSSAPTSENSTFVSIDGVIQHKSTYSISGTTLTFSEAPPNGSSVECTTLTIQTTAFLQDADGDTKIQMEESTDEDIIRMDIAGTEVLTLTNSNLTMKGTTPKITIGDGGAEDTGVIFDGNAQDYYIGLYDTKDSITIGRGNSVGSNRNFEINSSGNAGLSYSPNSWGAGDIILQGAAGSSAWNLWGRNGSLRIGVNHYYNGTNYIYTADGGATSYEQLTQGTNGYHVWYTADSGTAGNSFTQTERLRIDTSGNLQVGASAVANFRIGSNSDVIELKAKKDGTDDVDLAFQTQASGGTLAERVRIAGDGKVGIGTSSPSRPVHAVMNGDAALFDRIGSAGGVMLFANGGTVKGNINVSSSGFGISSLFSENDLFFPTSAKAHVGLGTTDFPTGMDSSSYSQLKIGGTTLSVSGEGNGHATFLSNNMYVGASNNMYLDGGGSASTMMMTQGAITFHTFDGSGGSADAQFSLNNRLTISNSGAVSVAGTFSAGGTKSFKIDHPLEAKKDTHYLYHSSIEGPQADLIYRGTVTLENGTASVNLDTAAGMTEGTFILLNREVQCFTTNESDWDAVKGSVSGNILTITCQDSSSTATVSWLVVGERKDNNIINSDTTDSNGKLILEPLKEE